MKINSLKQKYSGPKDPGSSNLVACKVSWDYGTQSGSMGAKSEISLEFKF